MSRIKQGLFYFLWGPEVEWGDCFFYTILSEILLGLIWLFTFERIGIHVAFSLIPWGGIVFLIWRNYYRHKAIKEKKEGSRGAH